MGKHWTAASSRSSIPHRMSAYTAEYYNTLNYWKFTAWPLPFSTLIWWNEGRPDQERLVLRLLMPNSVGFTNVKDYAIQILDECRGPYCLLFHVPLFINAPLCVSWKYCGNVGAHKFVQPSLATPKIVGLSLAKKSERLQSLTLAPNILLWAPDKMRRRSVNQKLKYNGKVAF